MEGGIRNQDMKNETQDEKKHTSEDYEEIEEWSKVDEKSGNVKGSHNQMIEEKNCSLTPRDNRTDDDNYLKPLPRNHPTHFKWKGVKQPKCQQLYRRWFLYIIISVLLLLFLGGSIIIPVTFSQVGHEVGPTVHSLIYVMNVTSLTDSAREKMTSITENPVTRNQLIDQSLISGNITDCTVVYESGQGTSGVYTIKPLNAVPFQVHCELEDGGWTVILKRYDGHLDFNKTWEKYKRGFGVLKKEFWIGNEKLYQLTHQKTYKLLVEFVFWAENKAHYTAYNTFKIDNEKQKYKLHIGGHADNGSDLLRLHNGMMFSTKDQDNGIGSEDSCPLKFGGGGFWYKGYDHYAHVVPTGPYRDSKPCMQWSYPTRSQVWKIQPQ